MAGTSPHLDEGQKKVRIEIIPLIDVIFFLLATFVLFTLSLDKIGSLPVEFPDVKPGPPAPPPEHIASVQVSETGAYYWRTGDGTPELIATDELFPRLTDHWNKHHTTARVMVRGDRLAKFGPAAMVFDEARRAGIKQVGIETLTSPTGK